MKNFGAMFGLLFYCIFTLGGLVNPANAQLLVNKNLSISEFTVQDTPSTPKTLTFEDDLSKRDLGLNRPEIVTEQENNSVDSLRRVELIDTPQVFEVPIFRPYAQVCNDGSCILNYEFTKVVDISNTSELEILDLQAQNLVSQQDLEFLFTQVSQNLDNNMYTFYFSSNPVSGSQISLGEQTMYLSTISRSFKDPEQYCTTVISPPFQQDSTQRFKGGACGQIAVNHSLAKLKTALGGRTHFINKQYKFPGPPPRDIILEIHNPENIKELTPQNKNVLDGMTLGEIASAHEGMSCKMETVSCDGSKEMNWEHVDVFIGNLTEKMKSTTPKYDCSLAFFDSKRRGHVEYISGVEKGVITTVNGLQQSMPLEGVSNNTPPNNIPSTLDIVGVNKYSRVGRTGALCKAKNVGLHESVVKSANKHFNSADITTMHSICCSP